MTACPYCDRPGCRKCLPELAVVANELEDVAGRFRVINDRQYPSKMHQAGEELAMSLYGTARAIRTASEGLKPLSGVPDLFGAKTSKQLIDRMLGREDDS